MGPTLPIWMPINLSELFICSVETCYFDLFIPPKLEKRIIETTNLEKPNQPN